MSDFTTTLTGTINRTCQEGITHPFIDQLSSGKLPQATFRYYLIQDHHYLTAFNQLHQLIADHLPEPDATILRHLSEGEDLAREKMHREINLSNAEITAAPVAPTAYAYISHMYYQLNRYGVAAAAAGLLPCYWLYSQVAQKLTGHHSPVPLYQEFFDSYAAADFTTSTDQMKEIVNHQASEANLATRQQMQAAFNISCYYEKQFWQMAFEQQEWKY